MNSEAVNEILYKLSLNPNNSELLLDLGAKAFNEKGFRLAVKCYSRLIALNITPHESYQNRGVSYLSLEKYEEAINDLTKSIEISNDSSYAYHLRAIAYLCISDDRACNDFKTAYDKGFIQAKYYMDKHCDYQTTYKVTNKETGETIPSSLIDWNEDGIDFLKSM